MHTATKTAENVGMVTTKTESKRVVQETVEATADLIANKITEKIILRVKPKNKGKEEYNETSNRKEIYIPPEKPQQITGDLRLF